MIAFSVLFHNIRRKNKLITHANFLFSVENSVFTLFDQRGGSNPLYVTTRFDSIWPDLLFFFFSSNSTKKKSNLQKLLLKSPFCPVFLRLSSSLVTKIVKLLRQNKEIIGNMSCLQWPKHKYRAIDLVWVHLTCFFVWRFGSMVQKIWDFLLNLFMLLWHGNIWHVWRQMCTKYMKYYTCIFFQVGDESLDTKCSSLVFSAFKIMNLILKWNGTNSLVDGLTFSVFYFLFSNRIEKFRLLCLFLELCFFYRIQINIQSL